MKETQAEVKWELTSENAVENVCKVADEGPRPGESEEWITMEG